VVHEAANSARAGPPGGTVNAPSFRGGRAPSFQYPARTAAVVASTRLPRPPAP
jgi:hypothetical protein